MIASSNRGIRQDKIILKSISICSKTANANYARAALWDTAIKFSLQSHAMTSPDHLDVNSEKVLYCLFPYDHAQTFPDYMAFSTDPLLEMFVPWPLTVRWL